ncbi:O-antigen ligase family protein [Glaciecola petra]|uniref:O-antigen ligase family protein n=1 Tax=Glaciecola petra TaxID=3075602 RepID=A0ABU2ZQ81_9ALTE|nr:O-antigen ligase family protein [Aestuariibacter sp. P117]MDT0593764.1 O-antigen ligase family protein [Aestuariibacter sp. P117]
MSYYTSSSKDKFHSLLAVFFALCFGMALLLVLIVGGFKLVLVAVLGVLMAAMLILSSNPRLLLLWLLVFSLPLALSKQFGEIVFKGGGEQAFRLELFDLFVGILLIFQLKDALQKDSPGYRIPKVIWLWLLIIVIGIVDVIQGPWRTSGSHELLRMAKVALLFVVLVNELKTPKHIYSCILPLALGIALQSSIGILQYLKGNLLGLEFLGETTSKTIENLAYTSVQGSLAFRPSALLLHANIFGIYIAVILPVLIGSFLLFKQFWFRVLLAGAISLGLCGLILSQSRSAWVGFAIGYMVLMILMISHRTLSNRALIATITSCVGMFVVLIPFAGKIFNRLFASKDDATVGRQVFMEDFFRLIQDHWLFGVGINSYTLELPPYLSFSESIYNGWIPPVHNIYFLWWGELGILGLFLHMWFWLYIIWAGFKNLKIKHEGLFVINVGCLAAMFVFAFDGFLSFSLRVSQPLRVFLLLSAIIVVIHYWRQVMDKQQLTNTINARRA